MRKFLVIVVVIVLIAAAMALYLKATTPSTSAGIRVPLSETQRDLLASAPANAQAIAIIPSAAVVHAKLLANPVTRGPVTDWTENAQVPRAWMIGDADLVVWRTGNQTSYATHLDPLRAAMVRVYLMMGGGSDARVSSGTFLINAGAGDPLGIARADQLVALANGLGAADALIVQQGRGDTFPPIGRPAVTAVQIGKDDVVLTSRAAPSNEPPAPPVGAKFPMNALVAATFRTPPRALSDLDRLFLARVSHLLDDGGSIVLYDVNTGTLLPRPDGLIVAHDTADNHALAKKIDEPVKAFGEMKTENGSLLVAFDKDSIHRFEIENFVDAQWPSNDWSVRVDAKRVGPILDRLSDNAGLRLAAPRIYRAARDLRRWTQYLTSAQSVEAEHSWLPAAEEMRVRIAAK